MATSDEVIDQANQSIDLFTASTNDFIELLQNFAAQDIIQPEVRGGRTYRVGSSSPQMVAELRSSKPKRPREVDFIAPTDVGPAPDNFNIRDGFAVNIPTFSGVAPSITIGTAPTLTIPAQPTAPSVNDITIPVEPTIVLPVLPTLATVGFPSAPSLQIPLFTEKFPAITENFALESDRFEYYEEAYQNDVLEQVSAILLDDLINGGFGVSTNDEELLYERQKDRIVQQSKAQETEIINKFAGRNFQIPPGSLVEILNYNTKDTYNQLSEANRDISTQRAELLRKGREFAITQGVSLNQMLLTDFGFRQERLLKAAQFMSEFAITVADFEIKRYNTRVAAYSAFSSAYELQIRAVLARTEIFKTEVDAAVAIQTSNKLEVDIYEAQIGAVSAIVNLFESQMRASQIEADIEKTRIDVFEAQISGFTAQVNAQKVTIDTYTAGVQGELAKAELFKAQVSAFEAEVRAASAQVDIELKKTDSDIAKANLELEGFNAEVDKYKIELTTELGRVNSLMEVYKTDNQRFDVIMSAWAAIVNSDTANADLYLRTAQNDQELDQTADQIRLANIIEQMKLKNTAATQGTDTYGTALSAAAYSLIILGKPGEE